MQTLAVMSCPCLSLTLVEVVLSIQIGSHHPIFHHSHTSIQISSHCHTVFSVLSRYHCPVIHHNQPCQQVLWQHYQWMMEGYLWWGTTQSVLNVMKAWCCKNTSIQCWSCKGLMRKLIMVRPRTVAAHVKKQYRFKDKHRHDMTAKVAADLNRIVTMVKDRMVTSYLNRKYNLH